MRTLSYDIATSITRVLARKGSHIIIDIGANEGETAARFAKEFPESTVYAFEPSPATFSRLKDKAEEFSNVRPIPLAAGLQAGKATFHITKNDWCSSLLPPTSLGKRFYGKWYDIEKTIEVPVVALDQWAAENKIDRVDFLKVDAQGFDLEVLRGARGLLERGCVGVSTECPFVQEYENAATFSQIDSFLTSCGFALHQIHELHTRGAEQQTSHADALWLKVSVLETLRSRKDLPDVSPKGRVSKVMQELGRDGISRVALYGAGKHTRGLLEERFQLPLDIRAIIDDSPAMQGQSLHGIPIISKALAIQDGVEGVILSSDEFEQKLWNASGPLREAGIKVRSLYQEYQSQDQLANTMA